jgi:L-seryl-tRNA(Ser) seleniumtransferase
MSAPADPRPALGIRSIVNAAGTETAYGASLARPEAVAAAAAILPFAVDIAELHRAASRAIAAATGAEAGFVTASAAAGITLAAAAAMTGADLAAIRHLPDTGGLRNEVVLQDGHDVDYGAPVSQGIRLSGARVRIAGGAHGTSAADFAAALSPATAAVLHVVSHHCRHAGELPLADAIAVARPHGVPVIVDAASEESFAEALSLGADLVIVSAHKFMCGLTAGIIAGRKDLVRAAYLQNTGIGRGMKVGKEGIAGAIAAIGAWRRDDPERRRHLTAAVVAGWRDALRGLPHVELAAAPDPTGNPVVRMKATVAPGAPFAAWELVDALGAGDRPVMVRHPEVAEGFIEIDPATLREGEAVLIPPALEAAVARLAAPGRAILSFTAWQEATAHRHRAWPD